MPFLDQNLFHKILINNFSIYYFGLPYKELAKEIYPTPAYDSFSIPKKNGKLRRIDAPSDFISSLQRNVLAKIIGEHAIPRPAAHGFVKGKSVFTNAQKHCEKTFVFNMDLKDFFHSISFWQVRGLFKSKPFDFPDNIASCIAQICCHEQHLPQGGISSPTLSNILCRQLDRNLQQLAKKNRATYTRYCDDITFSFTVKYARQLPKDIVDHTSDPALPGDKLLEIIAQHGFKINSEKTRLQSKYAHQEVTGLTVNKFPNVRRRFVDEIRGGLHAWEKFGLQEAENVFKKKHGLNKSLTNYLHGKLAYLSMVKGKTDGVYKKLADKYNTLAENDGITSACPINYAIDRLNLAYKAVFVIKCITEDSENIKQGTAFYVGGIGLITCDHNLWLDNSPGNIFNIDQIEIVDKNDRCVALIKKIIKRNPILDYAILEPDFVNSESEYLNCNKEIPAQQSLIYLAGFPAHNVGQSMSIIDTTVTSHYRKNNEINCIEIAQQIRQGNSGGPILDMHGVVLGIAVEGADQSTGKNGVLLISEILNDFHMEYRN